MKKTKTLRELVGIHKKANRKSKKDLNIVVKAGRPILEAEK